MSHKLVSLYIGDGEYYTRTDADLVIAEKDAKIADLIKKNKRLAHKDLIMASETIKEVFKELRYQKFKRCAAMATWCLTEKVYFHYRYDDWGDRGYDRPYKWKKVVFWSKWARRWLKIAEKFKEGV